MRHLIATISANFAYYPRNPPLGGPHSIFVPLTGTSYLHDLDNKRHNPMLGDLALFDKLGHMNPGLHSLAHHIVEAYEHPISRRNLCITCSSMKHSNKTFMEQENTVMTGNSPLVWDETMPRAFCRRNQPVLGSLFVLGEANTAVSVPGLVAQLNAEALSALAYTQVTRSG